MAVWNEELLYTLLPSEFAGCPAPAAVGQRVQPDPWALPLMEGGRMELRSRTPSRPGHCDIGARCLEIHVSVQLSDASVSAVVSWRGLSSKTSIYKSNAAGHVGAQRISMFEFWLRRKPTAISLNTPIQFPVISKFTQMD